MRLGFLGLLLCIFALSLSCTKKASESGTIYGLLDVNVKGIDPINASDRYSNRIVATVYEGLYNYHYLKRPLQLQPLLAEDMPKISADGLTYTIKIREGVFFQDSEVFPGGKGRELIAEDFIYSWKRLADPKNKSQGWWIFDSRIVGLNEWRQAVEQGKADYNTPIEGLKALDRYTLQIKITKVFYQFTHFLSMGYTKVVPHEAVKKYGPEFLNNPVGTGPFVLKEWIRNSSLVFIKNSNYRKTLYPSEGMPEDKGLGNLDDAGKTLPLADKLVIREITERQSAWLTFMQGGIDHTVIFKDAFEEFMREGKLTQPMLDKEIKVHIESRMGFTYEAMNMENPFFGKSKKLRQAIAMAYDRKTWIKTFYRGRAVPAHGPIPPGIIGYNAHFRNKFRYNPEEAKKLLAEAGYPGGKGLPVFNFEVPSTAARTRQQAEFVKQNLAEIGIKLKIIPNTWPQFDKKIKTKKADYFTMAWTADYPDGENFLQLFYSKNISPGPNGTNYSNRSYDALYEKAMSMPPGSERDKLYYKMVELIAEDVPLVPMVHRTTYSPYHSWLKNYKENTIIADFYKYLRVDEKKRKELKKKL